MKKPLRVLLLEDNSADAELELRELRKAGFEPDWKCVETEEGFLAAIDPGLDLILADYSMPHFDGMRALDILLERKLDIPFILVTGSIGEELAVEAMRKGAADYLLKDRLMRLGVAVTRALAERKLRGDKRAVEDRLVYLSFHDVITDLDNRAFFDEELSRLERGRQYPISIVVADIDHLKTVNDAQGHASGDAVIRSAAGAFRSAFRSDDIVARIGGDEFAAILPQSSQLIAKNAIARILDAVSALNRENGDSIISLSVGASTAETKTSLKDTLRLADEDMYQNKKTGGITVPRRK